MRRNFTLKKPSVALTVVIGLAMLVLIALAVLNRESAGVAGGPPSLSVLDSSAPSLPSDVANRPDMQGRLLDPSASRLAMSVRGKDIFVAKGKNNTVCLLVMEHDPDHTTSGTCQDFSVLSNRSIFVVVRSPSGQSETVGVVADGFASAQGGGRSAPVRNNVFALSDVQPQDIKVSGNGRGISADIGAP